MSRLGRTAFLLCDIQEGFRSQIHGFTTVVHAAKRMMRAAAILDIPLIATEQYPKGLGTTVAELDYSKIPGLNYTCHAKTKFSMCTPEVLQDLAKHDPQSVVLFGIESHVCILQTVLDLLAAKKYAVYLAVDGISSRHLLEKSVALRLMEGSQHPRFKEISKLVKETDADLWADEAKEPKCQL